MQHDDLERLDICHPHPKSFVLHGIPANSCDNLFPSHDVSLLLVGLSFSYHGLGPSFGLARAISDGKARFFLWMILRAWTYLYYYHCLQLVLDGLYIWAVSF